MIQLKRVYQQPDTNDGRRILVDRLWPRGITKERAQVDLWLKDVAPSPDLRRWFAHDPAKWEEFRAQYITELEHNPAFEQIQRIARNEAVVTLLYAAADPQHNHALVLKDQLTSA